MKTKYNKRQLNTVAKNTKILEAAMTTLESLTNTAHLKEMAMDSIQIHLLEEDGDGLVLCLEYDENGKLQKTFSSVDEFYEDTIEVELDDDADTALFDEEYYGGREEITVTVLDAEEAEDEFLKYDLHKIDKPLLN